MKSSIYYSALSEAKRLQIKSRPSGSTFSSCVVLFELIDEKQKSSRQHCYLFIFHISFLPENWRHKILTPFSTLFFPSKVYFIVYLGYISSCWFLRSVRSFSSSSLSPYGFQKTRAQTKFSRFSTNNSTVVGGELTREKKSFIGKLYKLLPFPYAGYKFSTSSY